MENLEEKQNSIVDKLLQKLDASPGFAGVAGVVQAINGLVDGNGSPEKVVDIILCDPALTSKLMQIANYSDRTISGRNVSTIDQALSILGLSTIKSTASELVPIESLPHKQQLNQLYAEITVAFFSGSLAAEITRINGSRYSIREAQVCGLMQNLGRMMSIFYIYEDIERSQKLQADKSITENEAVVQTLGLSFESISAAIARHWGLSIVLQNSLALDTVISPPQAATNAKAWYQLCSLFCRRITGILFRLPENRQRGEIADCIGFFQKALHLSEKDVLIWIEKCLLDADTTLAGMNFPCNTAQARNLLRKSSERTFDILLSQDPLVKNGSSDVGKTPIELIKRIMLLIHSHCSFDCTLICMPSGSGLIAIAGVGRNAGLLTTKFRSSGLKQDIFREAMTDSRDLFVPDVKSPMHAKRIPSWYHDVVGARSFVMLPLVNEGKFLGMIYGDYSEPHPEAPPGLAEGRMLEWRNYLIHIFLLEANAIAPKAVEPLLQLIHQGNKFTVDSKHPTLKIGRAEKADIVIQDIRSSRMHARIEFRRDKFVFVDLSSNGSYILIQGEAEIRLQGEEFILRDSGSICMGHSHKENPAETIEFFCQY